MRDRHVVVLTGAGISAESGLGTFRGAGGLWEGVPLSEVATPEGWRHNSAKVLDFYNARRKAVIRAIPNEAHIALKQLEEFFQVSIITQNIDDLHERAGSSMVLHLHGEIMKARSTRDPSKLYTLTTEEINLGDRCELGSQLRPHVVWFGEAVPLMAQAIEIAASADFFMVVGTSLEVYPAASLIQHVPEDALKFFIDPNPSGLADESYKVLAESASSGVPKVAGQLRSLMA